MTSCTPRDRLFDDARYLPYLPLIYVVWADGELDPAEALRLREIASALRPPGIDDQPVLASWLDPASPPTATEMMRVLRRVRGLARRTPRSERGSLAALGQAVADAAGTPATAPIRLALTELEVALGAAGAEAVRGMIGAPEDGTGDSTRGPERAFDLGTMTRLLDGRYHPVRARVRDLLASGVLGVPVDGDRAAYRTQVMGWLGTLGEAGIGALCYPQVLGRSEDVGEFIAAFEALADFDLSLVVKAGVQFGLFGGSVYFLGSETHHALLDRIADGRLPGCFAMTETGHGSNVRSLETTATFDPDTDEWVIHSPSPSATKDYIGNAACHGRLATVFAQLVIDGEGYGVHALLVPIRDEDGSPRPGVTITDCGPKMGLNGVDNGRIRFDRVRVPRSALLDRFAQVTADGAYHSPIASPERRFFTMLGTLVAGRISVGCAGVAAARQALAVAIRYGHRRRQFGPTGSKEARILDYPAHQERLLPALARAYAYTFAGRELVDRYVAATPRAAKGPPVGGDSRELEALAAGLKAVMTSFCTDTIQAARECCGGAGYLAENRFAALKADTDVFTTFEGDNTVLLQLAARGALTAFKAQLGDRLFGVLRHVADRAAASVGGLDPVTRRMTFSVHLRDPAFHRDALLYREQRLTWSAAGRLRARMAGGMDGFQAVIECQDHLLALAKAWIARHVHDCFRTTIEGVEEPGVRSVLDDLCALYALDELFTGQAWFLRNEVFAPAKARAIRSERAAMMGRVRWDALALVEAFAIPTTAVSARIG